MFRRELHKPDGRRLLLYSRSHALEGAIDAPSPGPAAGPPRSHLRWHPLRGEWVAVASHRQDRTFLPPPEWDPLAPARDPAAPTEVPDAPWDVAVFENRFPTLSLAAGRASAPELMVPTRPGTGACEVVVFGQDARGSLGGLPLAHVELIVQVWADRQRELGAASAIEYVFPFENRGVEVGVTLQHPHGQIYAYPFVPPIAARELSLQRAYFETHQRGLLQDHFARELAEEARVVWVGSKVAAIVPVCARYPYELWIAPLRPVPSLVELDAIERAELARALKTVLMKLDRLWDKPFPYLLVVHQAPTDGAAHPEAHVHIEIYPALRMPGRLKYLAGSEIGAGVFTADTLPEDKAAELRKVEVAVE